MSVEGWYGRLDCGQTAQAEYWKVTMAAPSYTNICPQSAGRPVNRSEYQNINLSPSYGREGEGRREGESLLHFIVSSCQQPIL